MKPIVLINFKEYKESSGKNALKLARSISWVKTNKYQVIVTPSLLTTKEIIDKTTLTVYSQHADSFGLGAHTGGVSLKELKNVGVKGTLLNHSERKLPFKKLKATVEECKRKKIMSVVCASTIYEVKKVAQLRPSYIAYEPKELIGKNVSVTEAKPQVIVRAIEAVNHLSPRTKFLCGAGIHSSEDLGQALLLGADGVLIGHAISEAKDPQKFLKQMLI